MSTNSHTPRVLLISIRTASTIGAAVRHWVGWLAGGRANDAGIGRASERMDADDEIASLAQQFRLRGESSGCVGAARAAAGWGTRGASNCYRALSACLSMREQRKCAAQMRRTSRQTVERQQPDCVTHRRTDKHWLRRRRRPTSSSNTREFCAAACNGNGI